MNAGHHESLGSRFKELSQAWIDEQTTRLERDLAVKETRVRDLGTEITHVWRDILLVRQELKTLLQAQEDLSRRYEEDLDRILKMSGVKGVDVGPGFIKVETGPIVINYQGKAFHIGEFRIEIYLNGFIHLSNTNNSCRYPFYDHPHVRDRKPCMGNHTEALSKLIAEGQWSTVVAILLSYLQSYNPEDAYCEITSWPEITDDVQQANR